MIYLKNITKTYNGEHTSNEIYKDLNFEVEKGDFIAIVGKSGSGKTSLLNIIAGLTDFDSGDVIIGEKQYSQMTSNEKTKFRGEHMSFIFQQFHLIPNLTVLENIELTLDINKITPRFSVDEILDKVGLGNKKTNYPFELSGGEQQRVAIARAFIGKTEILLVDEPTGNLDEKNAQNIMNLLKKLHIEARNTIILITHDMGITQFADKTYVLQDNTLSLKL